MYYLKDNPRDDYSFLYMVTESVNNENEFFRRIVNKLLRTDFVSKSKKVLAFLEIHKPSIRKVGPDGIVFGVSEEHDYKYMLVKILGSAGENAGKLVVMLDEFPETLENIIKDEGLAAGRHFLQSNRELRQDADACGNVRFIYAGSIGLENIVGKHDLSKSIIDLARIQIPPLKEDESMNMIVRLLEDMPFSLSENLIDYIHQKIKWLIPFYLQLVFEQLRDMHRDDHMDGISVETIDRAMDLMIRKRNHFEPWFTRLRSSIKGNEFNFVKEVLNLASETGVIESNRIYDLAVKHGVEDTHKDLIGSLVYDGYINNDDEAREYRYNSPILQMWWWKYVAN
jgi:hypothetical protein